MLFNRRAPSGFTTALPAGAITGNIRCKDPGTGHPEQQPLIPVPVQYPKLLPAIPMLIPIFLFSFTHKGLRPLPLFWHIFP